MIMKKIMKGTTKVTQTLQVKEMAKTIAELILS